MPFTRFKIEYEGKGSKGPAFVLEHAEDVEFVPHKYYEIAAPEVGGLQIFIRRLERDPKTDELIVVANAPSRHHTQAEVVYLLLHLPQVRNFKS